MFILYAVGSAGEFPVLAMAGETGARRRYMLGGPFDDPSEVNLHQLQTGVLRALESPGVHEVVVRRTRPD